LLCFQHLDDRFLGHVLEMTLSEGREKKDSGLRSYDKSPEKANSRDATANRLPRDSALTKFTLMLRLWLQPGDMEEREAEIKVLEQS
jgi:hypothetical protein